MEGQEGGALTVKVQHTALHSVLENVLFVKALDLRHLNPETEMIQQDHLL